MKAAESSSFNCDQSMSATAVSTAAAGVVAAEVVAGAEAAKPLGAGASAGPAAAPVAAATVAAAAAPTADAPVAAPDPEGDVGVTAPATGAPSSGRMRMRRTPTAPATAAAPTSTTPPAIAAVALPEEDVPPVASAVGATELDALAEGPPEGAIDELAEGLATAEPLVPGAAEPLPPGAAEPLPDAMPVAVPDAEAPGTAPPELVFEGVGHGLGLGLGLGLAVGYWAHSSSMVHSWAPSPPPADCEANATLGKATTPVEITANAASERNLVLLLARIGDGRKLAQLPREVCADLIDGHKVCTADRVSLGCFR